MSPIFIFTLFIIVRLASVFVVRTFYVPDEYWQSLEVAHKLVFGYGHLTWEWTQGIRSYIYPLIIAGLYKILALLSLDTVDFLVLTPRILQALLSAYSDYRLYIWTGRRKWALYLILVQFFWFYTASRTLANTFETALTTIALSYYPMQQKESSKYLWLAGLCCFIRPTAILVWLPLCVFHLKNTHVPKWELILKRFVVIGAIIAAIGVSIDSYIHGKLLITPWEFLKYNYFHNIGSFYGTHPWYWYFLTGLPTVLGVNFLPFLFGCIQTLRNRAVYPVRKILLITIAITLSALSTIQHKEFRFILILLPLCLYICTDTLARWSIKASRIFIWVVAILILAGNLIPAWYLSLVHQKGPIDVMPHLADIAKQYRDENQKMANILFLMPCHSTPYYSHIHQNVTMRFLRCEPNLARQSNYIDEAEQFYRTPQRWLNAHTPSYPKTAKPSHLVMFDSLVEKISEFLTDYTLLYVIDHAQYFTERQGKQIFIYERHSTPESQNNAFNEGTNSQGIGR